MTPILRFAALMAAAPVLVGASGPVMAQSQAQPGSPKAASRPAPLPEQTIPDPYKLNALIRTTVIALNQANMTGNYTVLRDLAAPGFQEANNSARLGEIFGKLRGRDLDLSAILFADPKLVRPPALMPNGLLRLSGFIPTRPEQVDFDMMFQFTGGQWRLFGIAVDTRTVVEAPAAAPESPAEPAPPNAAAAAPPAAASPPPPASSTPPGDQKPPGSAPPPAKDGEKKSEAPKAVNEPAAKDAAKPAARGKKVSDADEKPRGGARNSSGAAAKTDAAQNAAPPAGTASTASTETPAPPPGAAAPAMAEGARPKDEEPGSVISKALGSPF